MERHVTAGHHRSASGLHEAHHSRRSHGSHDRSGEMGIARVHDTDERTFHRDVARRLQGLQYPTLLHVSVHAYHLRRPILCTLRGWRSHGRSS